MIERGVCKPFELHAWPSLQEYEFFKKDFIRKNIPILNEDWKQQRLFANIPQETRQEALSIVAHFFFGAVVAYGRVGFPFALPVALYAQRDRPFYCFHPIPHTFSISSIRLLQCATITPEMKREQQEFALNGGGFFTPIPIKPFSEIAGVEEAAHSLLFVEKYRTHVHVGKPIESLVLSLYMILWSIKHNTTIPSANSTVTYHTSDIERRGTEWKVAYTKRYYPQYYPYIRATKSAVETLRLKKLRQK